MFLLIQFSGHLLSIWKRLPPRSRPPIFSAFFDGPDDLLVIMAHFPCSELMLMKRETGLTRVSGPLLPSRQPPHPSPASFHPHHASLSSSIFRFWRDLKKLTNPDGHHWWENGLQTPGIWPGAPGEWGLLGVPGWPAVRGDSAGHAEEGTGILSDLWHRGQGLHRQGRYAGKGPWAGLAHLECQGPGSPSLGLGPVPWEVTSLTESESVGHLVVSDSLRPLGLCSPPGFSVHGISQARILEWAAISFSRGSSQPRHQSQVCCIAGRLFTLWATREVLQQKRCR